jgi:hypothetical protein
MKRDARTDAFVSDNSYPITFHRPSARTGLAAGDHPIYAAEIKLAEGANERFA